MTTTKQNKILNVHQKGYYKTAGIPFNITKYIETKILVKSRDNIIKCQQVGNKSECPKLFNPYLYCLRVPL